MNILYQLFPVKGIFIEGVSRPVENAERYFTQKQAAYVESYWSCRELVDHCKSKEMRIHSTNIEDLITYEEYIENVRTSTCLGGLIGVVYYEERNRMYLECITEDFEKNVLLLVLYALRVGRGRRYKLQVSINRALRRILQME